MGSPANPSQELPPFDRRFFEGAGHQTRIGTGSLGGKAQGLILIKKIIEEEVRIQGFPGFTLDVPRMAVIATDFFDQFLRQNHLDQLPLSQWTDSRIAHAFQRGDLPVEMVGDLRALVAGVHQPLAVRSSSLLEDAAYRPFAGVYATKMIPNNQFDADIRFRKLVEAIKFVWASVFFEEARAYLAAAERDPREEKMAVIIQEVVGHRYQERFYPHLSGVARSYNFYPVSGALPEEGVVNLALGLGKTIVDGGVSWSYSPARPRSTPPFGTIRQYLSETQTEFWAVNMGRIEYYDPTSEVEYLSRANLSDAESDESLRYLVSTYDSNRDRLIPGIGAVGPRVLSFAPLLVLEEFPFNDLVKALLSASEKALGAKVEIEFAMTIEKYRDQPGRARFGCLQVRPMVVADQLVDIAESELAAPGVLLASDRVMGNGVDEGILDVVFVRPEHFDAKFTPIIAKELEGMNRQLAEQRRPYVLIGFGRWGSSHPWLGIPVNWSQISGAKAIVESTLPAMNVEPSQGSHFFHNLSSFRVSYFTLHHEGQFRIDWEWLKAQPLIRETEHVCHVRLDQPLTVRVDGRTARGLISRG